LTLFRLVAVIWGTFLLKDFIVKKYNKGFIICAALIYAGALGNLIDSMFYGMIFNYSDPFVQNIASLVHIGKGYTGFLHGQVVDMLYFPLIENSHYPSWIPLVGGDEFTFFAPIFNVADASISVGVITLLIFQNKFFKKEEIINSATVETNTVVDDQNQVL
jgi:signal peptidase II